MVEKMTSQHIQPAKPLSIEQVVARAQTFDYNPNIPLRHWLRSAGTLLKEVSIKCVNHMPRG